MVSSRRRSMTKRPNPDAAPPPADPPASEQERAPRPDERGRLSQRTHLVVGLFAPMALIVASAWKVRLHTVDEAYVSFRYAENLARGHGLVYNLGERALG